MELENIHYTIHKKTKTSKKVEYFVAYYILEDENENPLKLLVYVKGYGGGGTNESCKIVANYSENWRIESDLINYYFYYDEDDLEEKELFSQMMDLIYDNLIDVNDDDIMTCLVNQEEKTKIINSEFFDPEELLEEISENWGVFLKF